MYMFVDVHMLLVRITRDNSVKYLLRCLKGTQEWITINGSAFLIKKTRSHTISCRLQVGQLAPSVTRPQMDFFNTTLTLFFSHKSYNCF